MDVGIEILFNNGSKDYIDPVNPDDFDYMVDNVDTMYIIDNTYGVWEYPKDDVKSFTKYSLCEFCGYDSRYDNHSMSCKRGG